MAAAALLGASGCKCAEERPYTPFHIEPARSLSASPPTVPPSASAAPLDALPREATVAPPDATRFSVDGVPIEVAPDRVIDRALAADFDGDGTKDAVAWTRAKGEPAEAATSGELLFLGGKTPAGRVIATAPPFVPSGPGCKRVAALAQTGPRTVTLDVLARCESALVPRSPTRGLSVLAPALDRPTVLALRLADAAPGESLGVAVDSRDRDGDGRDDVRITTTLRSDPSSPEATADLVWLDRTAGPSPDRSEPAHSLAALGSPENVRAAAKAASAAGRFDNGRRLYATLCAESGTPRFFDSEGAPLPCPSVGAALSALLEAETRAAIQRKDLLAAVSALSRDGWYESALPAKTRVQLEKDLIAATALRTTTELAVDVSPRARAGVPRWSPLAFDTDGSLLVQTTEGVSRIRLPDGHVEDATEGVEAWPLTASAVGAPRWTGIALPCDVPELVLLLSDAGGAPLPSRKTPILAPRPGPCRRGGPTPTPDLIPLEWTAGRNAGLISGGLFGVGSVSELASGPPPRGSPRSPDGKALVVPWSRGFLVVGGPKASTWSTTTFALSDCVIASGAAAIACVRTDKTVIFTPGPEQAEKKPEKSRGKR